MKLDSGIGSSFSISNETMKWVGVKFGEGLRQDVVLPPKFCNVYFGKFSHFLFYKVEMLESKSQ